MNLSLIDTHAHLDMTPFDKDRDEVITRAKDAGVSTIITVGIDLESSRKAVALAEKYPEVLAAVGIHPGEAFGIRKEDIDRLAELAKHPRVVAIGETGLDFYRNLAPKEAQFQVLKWHLELAGKMGLPVIIHCRQAQAEMISLLHGWAGSTGNPQGKLKGVIHCFNGDMEAARRYLAMGFYISLGGYIGYPSAVNTHSTIRSIPEDRIMLETDCPFLPPQQYRGKRNEPSYVLITAARLAEVRKVSLEAIAAQTSENARRLFHLPRQG